MASTTSLGDMSMVGKYLNTLNVKTVRVIATRETATPT